MSKKDTKTALKISSPIFKYGGILTGLFLITLLLIISTPKIVAMTEIKVLSENQPQLKAVLAQYEVAEEKPKQIQIKDLGLTPPQFSAQAVLAQDLTTGQILFQKNIHQRLSPASTTKIMTALVALDYYKSADILTVKPESLVEGSTMGLKLGEQLSFRSLLYGMMLNSGNDAAFTLAANYPGGVGGFVDKMNQKANELNLHDTNFQNPAGFDSPLNYSSAYDLAIIAKQAQENSQLARIVSTKETSVESWDKTQEHLLKNLNKLLSEDGVIGIKTGYTDIAGENLVGLVDRNGKKILTVVLSSSDRFGETKSLMDWVYQNFEWEEN